MNTENEKIYGSSVIDQTDDQPNEEEIKYTDAEVAEARAELKNDASNEKIQERTSVDALSGTKVSVVDDGYAKLNELDESLERDDIRGKALPHSTIELAKELTGVDITDKSGDIAQYFESRDQEDKQFANDDYDMLRRVIGEDVTEMIDSLAKTPDDAENIIRRLMSQLYAGYHLNVQTIDDTKELSHIVRMVKKSTSDYKESRKEDSGTDEVKPLDEDNLNDVSMKSLNNLMDAKDWIEKYLEKRKEIDDRNRRLKPDYSIDDIETRTIEAVKVALDDAIEMKSLNSRLYNMAPALYKEFKNVRDREAVIKNWITDLKNSTTYFTLPTNDYNTIAKTIVDVEKFIFNALLAEQYKDYPIPEDTQLDNEPWKYYIESKIARKDDIDKLNIESVMILYVLAKSFKLKKIDDYNRRVLSYTLDMLSKLGRDDYREKFYAFAQSCYKYLG